MLVPRARTDEGQSTVARLLRPVTASLHVLNAPVRGLRSLVSRRLQEAIVNSEPARKRTAEDFSMLIDMISPVLQTYEAIRQKIADVCTPAELPSALRHSITSVHTLMVLCLMGLGLAKVAEWSQPGPPIPRYSHSHLWLNTPLPDPKAPIENLMREISHPIRFAAFMKDHGKANKKNPVAQFARSVQEFQDAKFDGTCENSSHLFCSALFRGNWDPHRVNLIDRNVFNISPETSHQFAGVRLGETQYVFWDSTQLVKWDGTVEEYVREHYPTMRLTPFAGITRFVSMQDSAGARVIGHLMNATSEMTISNVPMTSPETLVAQRE